MGRRTKYSPEVRARAVRWVWSIERDHPSRRAAVEVVADHVGCTPETLAQWVRRAEWDAARRSDPGAERSLASDAGLGTEEEIAQAVERIRGLIDRLGATDLDARRR